MSDLIYREDAKDFVRHAWAKGLDVIEYLDEVPAADVRPVVRGKWIRRCDSIFAGCPNCGCEVMQIKTSVFRDGKGRIDFCPNCGADMRGEE